MDVTILVAGNGTVAFVLTSASKTAISFASREDAAHAPQLIVTQPSAGPLVTLGDEPRAVR
jgi:hypothetical protein